MPCFSPLKGWKSASTGGLTFKRAESASTRMEVACGSCLGCRLDNSRMWAMRIVHEATLHESSGGSSFVTLTYRDDDLPNDWGLSKRDFTLFMKKLRKASSKLRYFMVGEYGDVCRHGKSISDGMLSPAVCGCRVGRPHYHAILFGKTFEDLEVCGGRRDIVYYTSKKLEEIWGLGFVQVGDVTMQSAGYTARYCLKKMTGAYAPDWYENIDDDGVVHQVQQEYATMSRRPGLGAEWFKRFSSDCFPSDEVPVPGTGIIKKVPRYYADIFEKEEPEVLEEVKLARKKFRTEHIEEYTPERLKSKYVIKKRQIEFLKREL